MAIITSNVTEIDTINKIKKLVFLVFMLIVFEAPLRKWVFPQYSNYLFFVRDPFILIIYFLALKTTVYNRFSPVIYLGIAFSFLGGLHILYHLYYDTLPYVIFAYGWRNYFYTIPLAGIIGVVFTKQDIIKLVKLIFYISIPTFFLAYSQSISPRSSWLNSGLGDESGFYTFAVNRDIIRPSGLFTSSFGQGLFLTALFAFLISIYIDDEFIKYRISYKYFSIVLIFAVFSLVISGQRGTFIYIIYLFFSGSIISVFLHRNRTTRFIKLFLLITFLIITSSLLFPKHIAANMNRIMNTRSHSQPNIVGYDLFERIIGNAMYFKYQFDLPIPELGYGIGFGGNAAPKLINREMFAKLRFEMEDEWSRHIVELGPVIGILFIAFRIFMCIFLGFESFHASIRQNSTMPLLIFSSITALIFYVQLTGNGLASGYVWFYVGITLSLCKTDNEIANS